MIRYTDINTGNSILDESLENYLMRGFPPGSFLTSVLANDLRLAVGRADIWNKERLPKIVNEVVFKMPAVSIGSYEAVENWRRDVDSRRSQYAAQKEKEFTWKSLKGEVREKVHQEPPF